MCKSLARNSSVKKLGVFNVVCRWFRPRCAEEEPGRLARAWPNKPARSGANMDALDYRECVGDDLKVKFGLPFPSSVKTKPNETIVFSYIVYKSRAHRDKVNAKVMADPRLQKMPKEMPFDMKRMAYGGFKTRSLRPSDPDRQRWSCCMVSRLPSCRRTPCRNNTRIH